MVCIRQATVDDLLAIQNVNALCLPENYRLNFYLNHILTWPQLLHVAEDYNKKIVGYVLGSLDETSELCHGQIASLAVLRTHRNLGYATQLMRAAEQAMRDVYGAGSVSLHVRRVNSAAFRLYSKTLGYKIKVFEAAYYRDGADAYEMIKLFEEEDQLLINAPSPWRDQAKHEMPLIQLPSPQQIRANIISEMPNPKPSSEAKKIVDQDLLDGDETNP